MTQEPGEKLGSQPIKTWIVIGPSVPPSAGYTAFHTPKQHVHTLPRVRQFKALPRTNPQPASTHNTSHLPICPCHSSPPGNSCSPAGICCSPCKGHSHRTRRHSYHRHRPTTTRPNQGHGGILSVLANRRKVGVQCCHSHSCNFLPLHGGSTRGCHSHSASHGQICQVSALQEPLT
jgi:hypothetical protein